MEWLGSRAALPLLRSGSPVWKPALAQEASALRQSLAGVDPRKFERALERRLGRRLGRFMDGVSAYRRHPYRRNLTDPPILWREGTTQLLDYGGAGPPLLVIPSLVNRAYILDLSERQSLLRHLAKAGFRTLLVDWDRPGALERDFTLTDYIAGRLESALEAAIESVGAPVGVIGYCMGGLLALALAQRRRREVGALALLATPWDFRSAGSALTASMPLMAPAVAWWLEFLGCLPTDALQSLFYGLDPFLVIRKFQRFAGLDPASPEAEAFVALEDWLNDGVPLAGPVARECLLGWYGANTAAAGQWRIAGRAVLPELIQCPSLVVVPGRDRIVPPASALALADGLKQATRLQPPLGHIGMVVGGSAPERLWTPLTQWLARHLGKA
ncbi:MAG: alpha/beta fold hydrolase [Proteobacteria bacterium]|nr:alpha/beta fold hydrolase [Pseudomonadota bacterium]